MLSLESGNPLRFNCDYGNAGEMICRNRSLLSRGGHPFELVFIYFLWFLFIEKLKIDF